MKTEFYKHIEQDVELEELKEILDINDINYEVSSADVIIDRTIIGSKRFAKYTVKLLPDDFEKVDQLRKNATELKPISIDDYIHLTELANNELLEILKNPSAWSIESEIVAKKILETRNYKITKEEIKILQDDYYSELRAGKSVPPFIQILYFLAIALGEFFGMLFILAGVGMGYYYAYGTATDPKGLKYYVYDAKARQRGKFILYGGVIAFVISLSILLKIFFS